MPIVPNLVAEEHRHNIGPGGEGFGHVMFLNGTKLINPVSIGPGIMGRGTDWPPMRRGIDAARADGATIVWCHNTFGYEDVPDWLAGNPLHDVDNVGAGGEAGAIAGAWRAGHVCGDASSPACFNSGVTARRRDISPVPQAHRPRLP